MLVKYVNDGSVGLVSSAQTTRYLARYAIKRIVKARQVYTTRLSTGSLYCHSNFHLLRKHACMCLLSQPSPLSLKYHTTTYTLQDHSASHTTRHMHFHLLPTHLSPSGQLIRSAHPVSNPPNLVRLAPSSLPNTDHLSGRPNSGLCKMTAHIVGSAGQERSTRALQRL